MKYLWKALSQGLQSYHGEFTWEIGRWYKHPGELSMCRNGFHASRRAIDAMQYVPMECLAKVEVKGKSKKRDNKECWEQMRIIKAWKWTKRDSVELAIYAAELVLEHHEKEHPDDKRPREAINAAKQWLKNPTRENQDAAKVAVRAVSVTAWDTRVANANVDAADWAARAAIWAADAISADAAWAADAAVRAAYAAAYADAARAAGVAEIVYAVARADATVNEILDKCEEWIQKRIKNLEEIYPMKEEK